MIALFAILCIASLIATISFATRRSRMQRAQSVEPALSPIRLGFLVWLAAFASILVIPLTDRITNNAPWFVPRLFPPDRAVSCRGGDSTNWASAFAWLVSWLVGPPLAAALGLRPAATLILIALASSIVTNHLSPLLPGFADEAIVFAIAWIEIAFCFRLVRTHQARTSQTCQRCGYDLSSTPDIPCPECGVPYYLATTVRARHVELSPWSNSVAKSWSVAAIVAMLAAPTGLLSAATGYLARGIPASASVQLAQQYEGNSGSPFLHAWPLTIAGLVAALLYQFEVGKRAWLLVPLGVIGSIAHGVLF